MQAESPLLPLIPPYEGMYSILFETPYYTAIYYTEIKMPVKS